MSETNEKGRFGLSAAEWDNLKGGAQYILTIVLAVTVTFLVLAVGMNILGL